MRRPVGDTFITEEGHQAVLALISSATAHAITCQESRPILSAQAVATAEFIFSVPGIVAQPPFSIRERWSHEAEFLNSISLAAELACC